MTSNNKDECCVCVSSFTKKRKKTSCPSCDFTCCIDCVSKYLISVDSLDICCMSCGVV